MTAIDEVPTPEVLGDLLVGPDVIEDVEVIDNVDPEFADLKLISFEDPRIHTEPPLFDFEKDGLRAPALAKAMLEKMLEWGGLGLSANQVGLPYKVFVMGTKQTNLVLFNPEVVAVSKETTLFREGCLTFPGLYLTLKRPQECVISYQDVTGNKVVQQFPGMAARIALHEYDHMNGLDFTVHASKFKVDWELKKLRKFAKKVAIQQQQRSIRASATRQR